MRPGATTRDYITRVLERLSLLGSVFLGFLALAPTAVEGVTGRALHSSTFLLNVSTICGIRWEHEFPPVY